MPEVAVPPLAGSHPIRLVYGSLTGFTMMVANVGGPVISMYFLACRHSIKAFLGTTAWFFFLVSPVRLPFSVSVGLVNPTTLSLAAVAAPVVTASALAGRRLTEHMDQQIPGPTIVILIAVSALPLLRQRGPTAEPRPAHSCAAPISPADKTGPCQRLFPSNAPV